MSYKALFSAIKRGRQGLNIGVSTGSDKLDNIIYGIQKKCLITIGADSGAGKSSFGLDIYIYNLLKNKNDEIVDILLYSFELSKESVYAKLLSLYIYDTYSEVISYKEILSMSEVISDEKYELIKKSSDWIKNLDNHITIYDKALSPSAIYATCKDWLSYLGEFIKIDDHREDYIPKNDSYKVVIVDHVALVSGPGSKKEKIDTVADYMIYFRNKCSITGIFIQQLNRSAKSMDRKLNGYELIGLEDFKDTSGTTDASEVVIALYYPYREKISNCEGYPIKNILKKRFRLCQIIKNRYGDADLNIGMVFYGEIGMFKELPKPSEITDYEIYLNLDTTQNSKEILDEKDDYDKNLFIL